MTSRRIEMTRCDHGGRPCPRIHQQATNVQDDQHLRDLPRGAGTLIVAALFLLIVIAEGLVPQIVAVLR
jgi:hypothetical protein